MWLVNIDNVYLKICFDVLGDVSSRTSVAESASPRPDLLEFTAGSDVSIVVKHEIYFILGKSSGQSLIS